MSEKEPRPEIENPLKFECQNCGNNEFTTKENTTLYQYTNDKSKNHLKIDCFAREGYTTIHFLQWADADEAEWVSQFDYAVDENGEVPEVCEDEQLLAVWRDHYGIKAVNEYDLTDRQQLQCNFLKFLLETKPDAGIMAEMNQPMPERTLPWSWK